MLFWKMIFILFWLAVLLLAVTQVIWPLFKGLPLFPMLNRKKSKLIEELEEARDEVSIARLEHAVKGEREFADLIRNNGRPNQGNQSRREVRTT